MLQAAVWRVTGNRRTGTRIAARTGMAVGLALGVWAATRLAQDDLSGAIWIGVIAVFIFQGAAASDRQSGLGERLRAGTVADVMDPPPPAVPADLSLSETLDRYLRGHEDEAFPVLDREGAVIGMVSFSSARELGASDPLRPVRDALIPMDQVLVAHPEDRLDDVAARLGQGRAALVLRDGRLVGAITGGAVIRWVSSRSRRAAPRAR
jgi:CBS domain-containing protein